jgi:hypothetical protein
MGRDKRVHEGFEVGAPPLGKAIANVPISRGLAISQAADWGQALIESGLEAHNLVVVWLQVITRQLEEGIGDLKHENVRVVVLVADEYALAGPSHAVRIVVLLEASKSRDNGGVLLRLGLFDTKRVVGQGVKANGLGLVCFEGERNDGWLR